MRVWRRPAWPFFSYVGLIALCVGAVALGPSIYAWVVVSNQAEENTRAIVRLDETDKRLKVQDKKIERLLSVTARLAKEGAEAHAGACALIDDYTARIADYKKQLRETRRLLAQHPNGLGEFTPDLFRAAIDRLEGQREATTRTRDALARQITCLPPAGKASKR